MDQFPVLLNGIESNAFHQVLLVAVVCHCFLLHGKPNFHFGVCVCVLNSQLHNYFFFIFLTEFIFVLCHRCFRAP